RCPPGSSVSSLSTAPMAAPWPSQSRSGEPATSSWSLATDTGWPGAPDTSLVEIGLRAGTGIGLNLGPIPADIPERFLGLGRSALHEAADIPNPGTTDLRHGRLASAPRARIGHPHSSLVGGADTMLLSLVMLGYFSPETMLPLSSVIATVAGFA